MPPRVHVGSLGIGGISPDVRPVTPEIISQRYPLRFLLRAAWLRLRANVKEWWNRHGA